MQICPMLENERRAAAAAASSTSASSSTTNGHWPPSSNVSRFMRRSARAHDRLPGGDRGGRGDHAHAGMRGERGARFRPGPRHIVEDAGRQAGIRETLHDEADRQRRLVRRLDDQRAARRQRRTDLPGVDVDRIVPGRDRADHADRRGNNQAANVAARRSAQRPADAPSLLGVVSDHLDSEADFLLGVRNRLALLARQADRR